MEIDEKTSKEDRSESFNDTGVVDIWKILMMINFSMFWEIWFKAGNDEKCAARKIDAENGRRIE